MKPCGRLWPNGEFSVGYAVAGGAERLKSPSELAQEWVAAIGLSLPSNSHSPKDEGKPKRGSGGLTSHGKKVLRNAVWRMQRLYGKKRLSFVTLTLPSLSFEESWYVSSNWAEIVRVFYQKLGRRLQSRGLPGWFVGCTEMQPKRSGREEHPALHLHFVCVGRKTRYEPWLLSPAEFRGMWASVLSIYIGKERDFRAVENVQQVKRDAAAYLAKYVSKGVSMEQPPRSDETGWSLPTSWYNVSGVLRRWVLDNVRRHPELIEYLEGVAKTGGDGASLHYVHSGVIEGMSGPGPHYYVGKLTGEFMREIIEIWRASVLTSG